MSHRLAGIGRWMHHEHGCHHRHFHNAPLTKSTPQRSLHLSPRCLTAVSAHKPDALGFSATAPTLSSTSRARRYFNTLSCAPDIQPKSHSTRSNSLSKNKSRLVCENQSPKPTSALDNGLQDSKSPGANREKIPNSLGDDLLKKSARQASWQSWKFSIPELFPPISTSTVSQEHDAAEFRLVLSKKLQRALYRLSLLSRPKNGIDVLREKKSITIAQAEHLWNDRRDTDLARWLIDSDSKLRSGHIVHLLIGSLLISPERILSVLAKLQPVPGDIVLRAYVLEQVEKLWQGRLRSEPDLRNSFKRQIASMQDVARWPEQSFQRLMRLVIRWSNDSIAEQILLDIKARYNTLPHHYIMWLCWRCLVSKQFPQLAFDFLCKLPDQHFQNPHPDLYRYCYLVLAHDHVVVTPTGPNFRYLPTLLLKGLPLLAHFYDRIIARALDCDHPSVAWDIYDNLQQSTIAANWQTHLRLLEHAFNTADTDRVESIVACIEQDPRHYSEHYVATYMMNMVRRIAAKSDRFTSAQAVQRIYDNFSRIFNPSALDKFQLKGINPKSQSPDPAVIQREPRSATVVFTLWSCVLCHRDARQVEYLWDRLDELYRLNDPDAVAALKGTDLLYNGFIWLNFTSRKTIPRALEIFQAMLAHNQTPTSRTWSIMISGFLWFDMRMQARSVFDLAQQCGFKMEDFRQEHLGHKLSLDDLKSIAAEPSQSD